VSGTTAMSSNIETGYIKRTTCCKIEQLNYPQMNNT